jgi:hypothetical protein
MDYLQHLRDSYRRDGLLTREAGVLMVETALGKEAIGFVQYTLRGPAQLGGARSDDREPPARPAYSSLSEVAMSASTATSGPS